MRREASPPPAACSFRTYGYRWFAKRFSQVRTAPVLVSLGKISLFEPCDDSGGFDFARLLIMNTNDFTWQLFPLFKFSFVPFDAYYYRLNSNLEHIRFRLRVILGWLFTARYFTARWISYVIRSILCTGFLPFDGTRRSSYHTWHSRYLTNINATRRLTNFRETRNIDHKLNAFSFRC